MEHEAWGIGKKREKRVVNPGFPFDFAQGGESFDVAQDREPVEPRISAYGGFPNDGIVSLKSKRGPAMKL